MKHARVGIRTFALAVLVTGVAFLGASCGGGSGGPGPDGPGQGLVLVGFLQAGVDNIPLNRTLEFDFSEPVDPSTVTDGSLQVREGPAFGITVPGTYRVRGSKVYFDPMIPTRCDLSDAGFKASTQYRVTLVGYPEEFSLKNTRGQPLERTQNYEFTTTSEDDPLLFDDQIPATPPTVIAATPTNESAAVSIRPDNEIIFEISENLDPCTVTTATVRVDMFQTGDPLAFESGAASGNASGFVPVEDQAPVDPTSWGGNGVSVIPTQRIPADIELTQTVTTTQIRLVPQFGRFPENALLVARLTSGIRDFGGSALPSTTISFTTENLPQADDAYIVENEGETPYIDAATTADINTERAPSRAQGFLLVSGDGDNGANPLEPSGPNAPPGCTLPLQDNDGTPDDFNPGAPVTLNTGATENVCPNLVDGSTAVVWEFQNFTIQSGITVTIAGVNPAIILVNGPVKIENGGILKLAGTDGTNGNSTITSSGTWPVGVDGGKGPAGGGDGGDSQDPLESLGGQSGSWPMPIPYAPDIDSYGEDGWEGYGSPTRDSDPQGSTGGGQGNAAAWHGAAASPNGPYGATSCGAGGGGGGHGTTGNTGGALVEATGNGALSAPARGAGGLPYDTGDIAMHTPSAGSGGGAGGYQAFPSYVSTTAYAGTEATGGGGGGGGGFVDITSSFDIEIHGTIDASGGKGGIGGDSYFCDTGSAGGGGGGSGGGIRLLTSASIDIGGGTLTTAGGSGGHGGSGPTCPSGTAGPRNDGGDGAWGRIVLEDKDGVIGGQGAATLIPQEGQEGFYRNKFDVDRFLGGGGKTRAVSDLFLVGAFNPQYQDPVQHYGSQEDFVVAIPAEAADAIGTPQILVEAQGFQMLPDGSPDMGSGTGWRSVGYFTNTVSPTQPLWVLDQIPPAQRPTDNTQAWGITNLDGCEYIQFRMTFIMGPLASIGDGGPFLDRWTIRFTHDQ